MFREICRRGTDGLGLGVGGGSGGMRFYDNRIIGNLFE